MRSKKGPMPTFRLFAALACAVLFSGCVTHTVSMKEVRDFAQASSALAAYGGLSARFRDTYEREQPYLSPAADKIARENDAKRRAAYDDFISAQKVLVLYMQTLNQLAGDSRYDLTPRLDELGDGIKANMDTQVEKRHVTAYSGLTRLLTRVILSNYQGRSVESMVREADDDVQALLEAMNALLRYYAKTSENEKRTVLGMFDVELPLAMRPQDRMLVTLAKVHYLNKSTEYKLIDQRFKLALAGLDKISLGHRKMRDNMQNLSSDEVRKYLAATARDLIMIREGLAGAR